ncbi:MAG: tRNA (adenosine(37)-N6)-threonylcarbamoyltransferase complex transferase subunit TsaD [Candidatus Altimarinota bacterium]
MKILAIESSCDETAAAIVEDGRKVLSSVIASQVDIHAATGGVVPEVAAREHLIKVIPVVEEALQKAGLKKEDVDGIAITRGPGLLSSLIIGYSAALTLSRVWQKPFIPVSHIAGHIYSNWLNLPEDENPQFPIMVLTVSGGHNELVLMKNHLEFELIGETLDDAAGEAFDKVAKLLGLGYPGGPAVAKAALKGNSEAIDFPRAMLKSGNFDFSFSGLKTAVLQYIEREFAEKGNLSEEFINDCAASFEECVADILSEKLLKAAQKYQVKEIHLAGGVSANQSLRAKITEKMQSWQTAGKLADLKFRYNANLAFCTDNAAMIGGTAFFHFQKNPQKYQFGENNFSKELPTPQLSLYV